MVRVGFPESPPSAGRLANSGDRRLAGISNVGLSAGQFSTYAYSTTPENFISAITETSNSAAVYPSALTQAASYNTLNQLTDLSGQTLSFDAVGNLLSDGQRSYGWDAENRLIGITYPGQSGKQTAFAYDGLSRRTAITSTPAGGSATTTSYLWCGSSICQARNAGNAPTRSYYAEGELVPGTPAQPYYYGPDQIGSARRVFASTTSAPAYGYANKICWHRMRSPGAYGARMGVLPRWMRAMWREPSPALRADLSRMWER